MKELRASIERIVSDGEWHKFHELIQASGSLVSEEQAQRSYRNALHKVRRDHVTISLEDQAMRGRKKKVLQLLKRMQFGKVIEISGDGYDLECRKLLVPQLPDQQEISTQPTVQLAMEAEALEYLNEGAAIFRSTGPNQDDAADFERHFRDLCRIVRNRG